MSFLFRVRKGKQPGGPAALDPNNPLTTGIVSCLPFTGGFGPTIDIVPGTGQRVDGGTTTWSTGPSGIVGNSWQFSNATTADLALTSGAFSIGAFFNLTNIATSHNIAGRAAYTSESVNTGWVMQTGSGGFANFSVFHNNAFAAYAITALTAQTLGDHTIVGTSDGVNLRQLFWDGRFEANLAANSSPVASTAVYGNTSASICPAYLVVIWNRVLSLQEVQMFNANPWQILQGGANARSLFGTNRSATATATGTSTATALASFSNAWNPSQIDTTLTLSNNNRTVTKTLGDNANGLVCTTPGVTTGKYYFESVHTDVTAVNTAIGIGNTSSAVQGIYLGENADTIGYWGDGTVYNAGTLQTTYATYSTGDNVSVAVDLVNNLIWFRVNGGNWNNSAANHPETPSVGGFAIPAGVIAHSVVNAGNLFQINDAIVGKFASVDWTYAAPLFDGMVASAAGTSSSSVIGSSQFKAVAAATGTSSSSVIAGAAGAAVATGAATSSVIGSSQAASPASAAGTSATSYIGSDQFTGVAAAIGSSATSYIGAAQFSGVAAATGTSTANAGAFSAGSTATASGTSTADAVGLGGRMSDGEAAGTSDATSIAGSAGTATASGTSTATGAGSSFFSFFSQGVAFGDSDATAEGLAGRRDKPKIVWIGRT